MNILVFTMDQDEETENRQDEVLQLRIIVHHNGHHADVWKKSNV
jgi:hypothetical protein